MNTNKGIVEKYIESCIGFIEDENNISTNNRIRVPRKLLEKYDNQGYGVESQVAISQTVVSVMEDYIVDKTKSAPIHKIPLQLNNPKSTKRTVQRIKKQNKVFIKDIPNELSNFSKFVGAKSKDLSTSIDDILAEGRQCCPQLFDYLKTICLKPSERKQIPDRVKNILSVCVMLLANASNRMATCFPTTLGAVLYSNGTSQQLVDLLCKMGITSSYNTITNQLMGYINKRQEEFKRKSNNPKYLPITISDNFERTVSGKFSIHNTQKEMISTITTLALAPEVDFDYNIVGLNEALLFYRMDYPKAEREMTQYVEGIVKSFMLNSESYLTSNTTHKRDSYLEYECWPSFLGSGNSNEAKTMYYTEHIKQDVMKEGVVVGDQVFAAFVLRAQRHRKLQEFWVVPGDWHFHQAMMRATLRHGWFFFASLVELLQSRVSIEGKNYNDTRVFLETFVHGMNQWLIQLFSNSCCFDSDPSKWDKLIQEKFFLFLHRIRSESQTLDALIHLMELGICCIMFKHNTRHNKGEDQYFLYLKALPLFNVTNSRNYFQLTSYHINQLTYIREYSSEFYQFIGKHRNLPISQSKSGRSTRFVAADEFMEMNHSYIENSNINVDPLTFPLNIQKRIYAKALERIAISGNVEHTKHWQIQQGQMYFVQIMLERLGNTYSEVINKVGFTDCVVDIFN
ncbi:predicted protein, partial [Naegleria gruberi]